MLAKNAPMADQIMVPLTMLLTFLANTFIAVDGLPGCLKPIADWNPLSATVAAMRNLFGNASTIVPANQAWPLEHPVIASIGWSLLLIGIALPLSVRLYRKQA